MPELPEMIADAQTTEERFLRQIFVRDQMAEWSKQPLLMAKAEGVHYWDVAGKRYLDALSGIYTVSVGHSNKRVIDAIRTQLETLHFSPPMHGSNPVAVQLANLIADLAPSVSRDAEALRSGARSLASALRSEDSASRLTEINGAKNWSVKFE